MMLRNNLTAKNRQSLWMKANKRASSIPSNLIFDALFCCDNNSCERLFRCIANVSRVVSFLGDRSKMAAARFNCCNRNTSSEPKRWSHPLRESIAPPTLLSLCNAPPRFLLTPPLVLFPSAVSLCIRFFFSHPFTNFRNSCPNGVANDFLQMLNPLIKCHFNAL